MAEIALHVVGGPQDGGTITLDAKSKTARPRGSRVVYRRRYVRCRDGLVEWLSPDDMTDKEALEMLFRRPSVTP